MNIEDVLDFLSGYNGDIKRDIKKAIKDYEMSEVTTLIKKMNVFQEGLNEKQNKLGESPVKGLGLPILLSIQQAMEYTGLAKSTIHKYIHEGKLKSYRVPPGSTNIRIRLQDLHTFLHSMSFQNKAYCKESNIHLDNYTRNVSAFEDSYIYDIVCEDKMSIYLFNSLYMTRVKFKKKEFRKYFRIANQLDIDAAKFNLGNHFG